ncbi:MAG: hypothetical protein QME96_15260, partial [Myxococcota bacterium]|nr:hypothetical protein [Myxococcota bacterium]
LVRKAAAASGPHAETLRARSRVHARTVAMLAADAAVEIAVGTGAVDGPTRTAFEAAAGLDAIRAAQAGRLADEDAVAKALVA